MLQRRTIASPIGPLGLVSNGRALTVLELDTKSTHHDAGAILDAAEGQLAEYFAGTRTTFTIPLAPEGTEFQRAVWNALLQIPFGETRSYLDIARAIDRPRAVRAVGAANGANPIALIIPCHRVIGASGSLTGYGGGLDKKRWLLAHEMPQLELRHVEHTPRLASPGGRRSG